MAGRVLVIKNDFPRVAAALHVGGDLAEREAAKHMAEGARERAPFDTGALRDSIRAVNNEVVAEARHARFVEYGTIYMAAEPFFFEAAEHEMPRFVERLFAILLRFR